MRRWITLIFILAVLLGPVTARAQSTLEIDSLEIDIWPEYDRPEVLVILRLELSSAVSLPAELTLRIPRSAVEPFTLALKDVDGMLYNLPYKTANKSDWVLVTFTTPSPQVQLEYYDPALVKNGNHRDFLFRSQVDYPVNALTIQVQQPNDATAMTIAPSLGAGQQAADGYTYFSTALGAVEASSSVQLRISYDRPVDAASAGLIPVQPVEELDANTPGKTSFERILPWMVGSLGVLIIAAGVYWYFRSIKNAPALARKRHAPSQAAAGEKQAAGQADSSHIYCHSCGRRAQRGDVFCRACGTKLRYE